MLLPLLMESLAVAQPPRFLKVGFGFVHPAEFGEGQCQVVIGVGIFGLDSQQLVKVLHCFVQLSGARQCDAEVLPGRNLIGFQPERFAIVGESFFVIFVIAP